MQKLLIGEKKVGCFMKINGVDVPVSTETFKKLLDTELDARLQEKAIKKP